MLLVQRRILSVGVSTGTKKNLGEGMAWCTTVIVIQYLTQRRAGDLCCLSETFLFFFFFCFFFFVLFLCWGERGEKFVEWSPPLYVMPILFFLKNCCCIGEGEGGSFGHRNSFCPFSAFFFLNLFFCIFFLSLSFFLFFSSLLCMLISRRDGFPLPASFRCNGPPPSCSARP